MSKVNIWYIIQNYVLKENWFNHPFVLIPNHTPTSKSCCLSCGLHYFVFCEYTSFCKWNQGLLRRIYYCAEKMSLSSENLAHPFCTCLKKEDSLLKHNQLDHCHSYGSPSSFDPGSLLPNIPISLQASTWGRCPAHPVPLFSHAPPTTCPTSFQSVHASFEPNLHLCKYPNHLLPVILLV